MKEIITDIDFETSSPVAEKPLTTEELEEKVTKTPYPYTIRELHVLHNRGKEGIETEAEKTFQRKVGIVIKAHHWLPESAFRQRSGHQSGSFVYSNFAWEKIKEYYEQKSTGITDDYYRQWLEEQNANAIAAVEAEQKTASEQVEPIGEGVEINQVTAIVLSTRQSVTEAVNSLPTLTEIDIPELEINLPQQPDVVENVQELFNIVKAETEKSIEEANAERAKLSQVNQLVDGIQQMVQTKAQADHQKAQDSASLEQMGERLAALQKMLGKA